MGEKAKATELEWLKWFYQHCDFGPAHGDVMCDLEAEFTRSEDKEMPDGYSYNEDGE